MREADESAAVIYQAGKDVRDAGDAGDAGGAGSAQIHASAENHSSLSLHGLLSDPGHVERDSVSRSDSSISTDIDRVDDIINSVCIRNNTLKRRRDLT